MRSNVKHLWMLLHLMLYLKIFELELLTHCCVLFKKTIYPVRDGFPGSTTPICLCLATSYIFLGLLTPQFDNVVFKYFHDSGVSKND